MHGVASRPDVKAALRRIELRLGRHQAAMRGAHCDEGNGKTVLARFGNFAAPSTLWESGHFYFASTDSAQYVDSVYTLRYNTMVADGIEFDWDAGNREHLADHKVTAREFEAV